MSERAGWVTQQKGSVPEWALKPSVCSREWSHGLRDCSFYVRTDRGEASPPGALDGH